MEGARSLEILMPMAGLGSRFQKENFTLPKPLIDVEGQAMFSKAVSSFDTLPIKPRITAVIRRAHDTDWKLATQLKNVLPEINIVIIDEMTRGAIETCLRARGQINESAGLVILDCDLWFHCREYTNFIMTSLNSRTLAWAGGLIYFSSSDARFSYVKIHEDEVSDIAEKKVISDHAVIGSYFFASAKTFFDAGEMIIEAPFTNNECYISLVYKKLLDENYKFKAFKASQYHSFGTPDELEIFQNRKA